MSTHPSESEAAAEARIADLGRQIARLLSTDAEYWFSQEIRARFIASPEVADALSDEALATLKIESRKAATGASTALHNALSPAEVWLGLSAPASPDTTLMEVTAVKAAGEALSSAVNAFLSAHNLAGETLSTWRLPVRFIDGADLPSLTRNLHKQLHTRAQARAERAAQQSEQARVSRRQRWDEA